METERGGRQQLFAVDSDVDSLQIDISIAA